MCKSLMPCLGVPAFVQGASFKMQRLCLPLSSCAVYKPRLMKSFLSLQLEKQSSLQAGRAGEVGQKGARAMRVGPALPG